MTRRTFILLFTAHYLQSLPRQADTSVAVYESLVERGHGESDLSEFWDYFI